jgi:hypothetical protein
MTMIDRLAATGAVEFAGAAGSPDATAITRAAVGDLGHRILAWSAAIAGPSADAGPAWRASTHTAPSDFRPEREVLTGGGDVYGLRDLAAGVASLTGATPTEEGQLLRAFEDFARAAALAIHGSAGAGEGQTAAVGGALDRALDTVEGDGAQGVISRLDAATRELAEVLGL